MKTGDRVKVHDPAWRDATGREYEAGTHHGATGTILEATDYKVGDQRIYDVKLDSDLNSGRVYPFWTNELIVEKPCPHNDTSINYEYKADKNGTLRWTHERCNLCGARRRRSGKRGSDWLSWSTPSNKELKRDLLPAP